MARANRHAYRPWGRVAALLAACCVTLTGILCGLDPDVIAIRATLVAIVIGIMTSVWTRVLRQVIETNAG